MSISWKWYVNYLYFLSPVMVKSIQNTMYWWLIGFKRRYIHWMEEKCILCLNNIYILVILSVFAVLQKYDLQCFSRSIHDLHHHGEVALLTLNLYWNTYFQWKWDKLYHCTHSIILLWETSHITCIDICISDVKVCSGPGECEPHLYHVMSCC